MYVIISDGHVIEIEKEESNIFGVGASMEKFSHTFVIGELSLSRRYPSPLSKCVNFFA
jgi:hypothetical protein